MKPDESIDEFISEYLMSPTPEAMEQLIRFGHGIVHPLVQALVGRMSGFGASVRSESERKRIREYEWSEVILEPLLMPAHLLITQIGEPGQFQLCRALRHPAPRVRVAAAVLLAGCSLESEPTVRVMKEIRDTLFTLNVRQDHDATMVMVLSLVLARGGDAGCRELVEKHARDNRISIGEWASRTVATGILDLLGWR